MPVTASDLYDYVQCPHRVTMNIVSDPSERDPVSPFVELLWERGNAHELEVIAHLAQTAPVVDLSIYAAEDRERRTLEAMRSGADLIYGGRLHVGNFVGVPDLLRREGEGYIPGDIKSGRGREGGDDETDRVPKLHYAVQLAFYVDLLERLEYSAGRRGFILDIQGEEVAYDLSKTRRPRSGKSLWQEYEEVLHEAEGIYAREVQTRPALTSSCKLCHWHSACLKALRDANDLTLIPRVGRTIRDAMLSTFPTIADLASSDPELYVRPRGKTTIPSIGANALRTFHQRAKLLSAPGARPYLKHSVHLRQVGTELLFDIETDPMRDICYLHGFLIREGEAERFTAFFAEDANLESERMAFANAISLLNEIQPDVLYHYSNYERAWYRKLQSRYPDVCSSAEIEKLFVLGHAIDLYGDVVLRATEWPTNDYSIKTLARYAGFEWRDGDASGAASMEWYSRWIETRDVDIQRRILSYNEDDCRAMHILLKKIRELEMRTAAQNT